MTLILRVTLLFLVTVKFTPENASARLSALSARALAARNKTVLIIMTIISGGDTTPLIAEGDPFVSKCVNINATLDL